MTLEEAINHCDEVIKDETSCGGFACADEHRQLKEWLQELKQHRENVKKVEQKPAEWSEEDELSLKQAIYVCHQNGYTAVENWLKSLRPQPKEEWSEEDERLLSKLQDYVDIECFDRECNGQALLDWLKSLRPQPHWEPTKEQMEALKCAVEDVAKFSKRGGRQVELENEPYYSALHSLYEQLKS